MKETKTIPQFLIAAPTSGAGKTTIATGLMSLLARNGMTVQPFKCGPDYIDTKFHGAVCGRPSVNLDTFMASGEHVRDLFAHYSADADVAVVEGMMGLFDGYDRSRGSAAEIARLLGIPVVLVVDAKSTAYSIAPLLYGFREFDPEVKIAGVIFNRVGSAKHRAMLADVCNDLGMECFGFLPKNKNLEQKSRYLGLDFSEVNGSLGELRSEMEKNIDWKLLLAKTSLPLVKAGDPFGNLGSLFKTDICNSPTFSGIFPPRLNSSRNPGLNVGGLQVSQNGTNQSIISDEDNHNLIFGKDSGRIQKIHIARNADSFSFIYQEHLDMFARLGEVSFFDPEENKAIPNDIDLLYLPGGYPEKHLDALAAAADTRRSVREYAEGGGRIIAECGGMIYLCQDVITDEGTFPMVGFIGHHITAKNSDRKLSLGYRQFEVRKDIRLRGHEFHYTQFAPPHLPLSAAQVYDAKGNAVATPIIIKERTIASYTHLYLNS